MDGAAFSKLRVWHRLLSDAKPAFPANSVFLETCQRQIALGSTAPVAPPPSCLVSEQAYRFLLEVATGLRSNVIGETNVFGQLKAAWSTRAEQGAQPGEAAIFDALFVDAAAIRQRYLQGLGGRSYGSLARKIVGAKPRASVLIIGAGQLAQEMLPFFSRQQVRLLSRNTPTFPIPTFANHVSLDDLEDSVQWAKHILLCIPQTTPLESRIAKRMSAQQSVVHMGISNRSDTPLDASIRLSTLADLFALQAHQNSVRSIQVAAAKRACRTYAENRYRQLVLPIRRSVAGG